MTNGLWACFDEMSLQYLTIMRRGKETKGKKKPCFLGRRKEKVFYVLVYGCMTAVATVEVLHTISSGKNEVKERKRRR